MAVVQLLSWENQAGVALDARLIRRILEAAGHEVIGGAAHLERRRDRLRARVAGMGPARYDLNLFIEAVEPALFGQARRNVVIPNPEWWGHPAAVLRGLDRVFCKTRSAVQWLSYHGGDCTWIGFTSEDRREVRLAPPPGTPPRPLHVAGKSPQKGTAELVRAWSAHPEWPQLTVVARAAAGQPQPDWSRPNVRHLGEWLDDAALRRLQNASGFHLCPSDVEGFGHTLVEAASCGALILTMDAPPMNELVNDQRGVLVPVSGFDPMRLGFRARIDPEALEVAIGSALELSAEAREAMGGRARRWFEENDAAFPGRLLAAVEDVLRGAARSTSVGGPSPRPSPQPIR